MSGHTSPSLNPAPGNAAPAAAPQVRVRQAPIDVSELVDEVALHVAEVLRQPSGDEEVI